MKSEIQSHLALDDATYICKGLSDVSLKAGITNSSVFTKQAHYSHFKRPLYSFIESKTTNIHYRSNSQCEVNCF